MTSQNHDTNPKTEPAHDDESAEQAEKRDAETHGAGQNHGSAALSDIPGHPGGSGQAGTADPEPGIAENQGGGIEGAVGGGQSGQGGG
jgi:hypothetical protein